MPTAIPSSPVQNAFTADYPRLPLSPLDYPHRTRENAMERDSLQKRAFRVSSGQQKTFRLFGVSDRVP